MIERLFWRPLAWFLSRPRVVRILYRRALRTPYTSIYGPDGRIYMARWWLFNPVNDQGVRRHKWCPWSLRVHHIKLPDAARVPHTHPWNARTFVLWGGYMESRETNGVYSYRTLEAGGTARLRLGDSHRVISVDPNLGALTLFVTGPAREAWGFKESNGEVSR